MIRPRREAWVDLRPAWWADDEAVAGLDFGLAVTVRDFEGAFRLLHDQFVWRGYMQAASGQRRLSVHHLLPSTKLLVARRDDAVVATLTVVEDSRLGLPIDEAIGAELGVRRAGGRRLGELGALAVDAGSRAAGVPILVRLFRMAVLYAASIARLDELAFVIHPRHLTFYRALFPFREVRGSRSYRRLDGVAVLGLWFDLALVRALIRVQRASFPVTPLMRFMFGPESAPEVLSRLRRELPRSALTPPEWARVLADADATGLDPSTSPLGAVVSAMHCTYGGQP